MYYLNNQILNGGQFTHEGVTYPSNWLANSTKEDRDRIGIVEIQFKDDDHKRPNDKFYIVVRNNDGTYTKTPRDLNSLKEKMKSDIRAMASKMLSVTDWMVIKSIENGVKLDQDTHKKRSSIRSLSNKYETKIDSCKSVEDLEKLKFDWSIV